MHNTTQFWLILLITIISIGCQSTSEGDLSTRAVLSDTARTTIEITRPVTETAVSPTPNHPTPPPPLVTPPLTANIPTSLFYIDENTIVQFDDNTSTSLFIENEPIYDLQLASTKNTLYYRGESRIVRFDLKSGSAQNIVNETTAIQTFQLSPDNTALVYVHNNQLIMTDAFGKNRQILVTGQPYPSDDDDVPGVSPWHMKDAIHSPMWAPTGDKIAFVMGGVQLIQTDSVPNGIEPKMIQPNIPKPCEDCGSVTPVYLARPESWSPNGRFLTIQQTLVAVHAEEWATAVADLETDTVIFPPFSSSAAHYTIWKPDSSTAYIWNDHDFYDGYPSSLELYDPIMQTVTPIITNSRNWGEIGEHYRWLRYPMLTAGGELYFFFNHEPEFPQWPPTFTLMKTTERFWETGELSDLTTVFPHTLPISYVKWAPQHEGALLYLDTDDQSESSKKVENWYWLSLIDDGLAPLNLPEKCHFITWPK